MQIFYVSAPCGAGKTFHACNYIAENIEVANYLYVVPTLDLIEEIAEKLRKAGLPVIVITHETHPNHVKGEILKVLTDVADAGCVLLITRQAFVDLPFFPKHVNWRVIVDEIPQLDEFFALQLPLNQHLLRELLDIKPVNEAIALVKARDVRKLRRFVNQRRDDVFNPLMPVLKKVLCKNYDVFVDLKSWTRIVEQEKVSKVDEHNRVFFLSLLNPCFLANAIILGANFERSLIYEWFKRWQKVQFCDFPEISGQLRGVETATRDIEIRYFLDERFFSKYRGKQRAESGETVIEVMNRQVVSQLKGAPFLYVVNNGVKNEFLEAAGGRRISSYCHGLNSYDTYHNIYFSAALNREPAHLGMLRNLGFDLGYVHSSTTHESMYQAAMRLSLRRPDGEERVRIFVPDRGAANHLAESLGAQKITKVGDIRTAKQPPLSGTERNRSLRARKLRNRLFAPKQLRNSFIKENCHQNGAEQSRTAGAGNLSDCIVTFHSSQYDADSERFVVEHYAVKDFIADFRTFGKETVSNKDDRYFFNPAHFDPTHGPGYRTQANFVCASMIVLDFDNGKLYPDKFEKIFWHEAGRGQKRSFMICNSFSRSPEQPNRFRAIILLKRPAYSIAAYQAVFDSIVAGIESAGFSIEDMGLDKGCRSGVQSFYVPCTNRAHPDYAFFRTHGTKAREIERYGIDPSTYLRTAPRPVERATQSTIIVDAPENLAQQLEDMKTEVKSMPKGAPRHQLFFKCASKLSILHKGDSLVVATELRALAGSDQNLRKKVKPALGSLKRYGLI